MSADSNRSGGGGGGDKSGGSDDRSGGRGGSRGGDRSGDREGDGETEGNDDFEVRLIHPFQARKTYVCPGCQQEIPPGLGHLVVVPRRQPDQRRHWHRPCWEYRRRRRPGR